MACVGGEQPGQPTSDRIAAAVAQLAFLAVGEMAEVVGQRRAPGLVEAVVDHRQQRPHHGVGGPRIAGIDTGQLGQQGARVAELDACAHPEPVGQPLTEPALDTLGGHQHQLGGERIGHRLGEHRCQAIGEHIGALGTVQVQGHRRPA